MAISIERSALYLLRGIEEMAMSISKSLAVAGRSVVGRFGVAAMFALATGMASAQISQVPLFLGEKATPNLMYVLDDSGSMKLRFMPDEIYWASDPYSNDGYGVTFHPRDVSTNSSGSSVNTNTLTTRQNDLWSARMRSNSWNVLYYNPEVRYQPWYNSDGTQLPNATPEAAWLDPNDRVAVGTAAQRSTAISNGDAVNLVGETTYSSSTRWCRSTSSTTANLSTAQTNNPTCNGISGEILSPATYYTSNGGNSYTRVRIMDSTTFTRGAARTDCTLIGAIATCTQAQEYQNFANWFTYYRNRMSLAIAATSRAFSEQGTTLRVGYGLINKGQTTVDGRNNTGTVVRGVRDFSGTDRNNFFSWLFTATPTGSTPLRRALDDVGQYYSWSDSRGPWGSTPGTSDGVPASNQASCRKCYTILMTDGYWTSGSSYEARDSSRRANVDGSSGPNITGPDSQSYQYSAAAPYSDSQSNTLADIAMYYWNRDLRTDLSNRVVPDPENEAFWQHMVTFTAGLGVTGTLDPATDLAGLEDGTLSWPTVNTSTPETTIDDLWHAAINGRGQFFSAKDPVGFAEGLSDILASVAAREESSSSSIAANSTRLDTGTLIYQARFKSSDWSGQIVAYNLNSDGSLNQVVWDTDDPGNAGIAGLPASSSRNIFTSAGVQGATTTTGMEFSVANWLLLDASQRASLNNGAADAVGQARLNWLRGNQSDEGSGLGFRVRDRILGDIINSDPLFIGSKDDFGYLSLPGTEGATYAAFLAAKSGRREMLYVGANDGMLHGFDALTGREIFAYVPLATYPNLYQLTDPAYQHRYFVDGSARGSDAYVGGSWRSVIVGSMGAGGRSVFALNVTNPDSISASSFMWEYAATSGVGQLGVAMSQPIIARVKAGDRWVAIFGNGYGLASGNVRLLVVDLASGALIESIDTGVSAVGNSLGSAVPVDINNDRITDYVYAGDLQGNLWKFDFTGSSTGSWAVSPKSGSTPLPLFVAVDRNGVRQPITARPAVGRHPDGGQMIYFGTGKYFEVNDNTISASPQIQTFYGVRDLDDQVDRSDLVEQEIIFEGVGTLGTDDDGVPIPSEQRIRAVSNNYGSSVPSHGWFMDLVSPPGSVGDGERVVATPILRFGRIIFTTIIPTEDPCDFGGTSWLMELDAITGGRLSYSVIDVNNDGVIDENDYVVVDGERVPVSGQASDEMIKTPGIVGAGELEYKYTSGSSGSVGVIREKGAGNVLGRQSWRQMQ